MKTIAFLRNINIVNATKENIKKVLFCFVLSAVLPVDPVKENYVRKVKNCVFSIAFPTPFKSRVHLVAVSKVRFYFFTIQILNSLQLSCKNILIFFQS